MITKDSPPAQHSQSWVTFTYASFVGSLALLGGGILFLPLDIWIKGYFLMGTAMVVQSCITLSKTIRDMHEGSKLISRIDEARAERLLMEIDRKS